VGCTDTAARTVEVHVWLRPCSGACKSHPWDDRTGLPAGSSASTLFELWKIPKIRTITSLTGAFLSCLFAKTGRANNNRYLTSDEQFLLCPFKVCQTYSCSFSTLGLSPSAILNAIVFLTFFPLGKDYPMQFQSQGTRMVQDLSSARPLASQRHVQSAAAFHHRMI
jgi:hypothetical protein